MTHTDTIPIYLGYDYREAAGTYVFMNSVLRRASRPVAFYPLALSTLRGYDNSNSRGTNEFIQSRFLIPYLQGYKGYALFVDGADMLMRADIAELWDMRELTHTSLMVVKHDYKTKYPRKYVGTPMENDNVDYPRKNWSSVMLINCGHAAWQKITPEVVSADGEGRLHRFEFLPDNTIRELPPEWNHLVGEMPYNPNAKLVHYTLGVPAMRAYATWDYAEEWREEANLATYVVPSREPSRPAVFNR